MHAFVAPSAARRWLAPQPRPLLSPAARRVGGRASTLPHERPQAPTPASARSRTRPPAPLRVAAPSAVLPVTEKERSGSPDSDRPETTNLSYSVGVTIVTGPSAALRRSAIRALAAQASRPVTIVSSEHNGAYETIAIPSPSAPANNLADTPKQKVAVSQDDVAPRNTVSSSPAGATSAESTSGPGASLFVESGESDPKPDGSAVSDTESSLRTSTDETISPQNDAPGQIQTETSSTEPVNPPSLARWCFVEHVDAFSGEVARIAAARDCECIIVDCPSLDSPRELAVKFHLSGSASLRVDSILCVLDGSTILDVFQAQNPDASETSLPAVDSLNGTASSDTANAAPLVATSQHTPADSNGTAPAEFANRTGGGCPSPDSKETLDDSQAMRVAMCVENANIVAVTGSKNFKQVRQVVAALNLGANIVQFDETADSLPFAQVINTNLYNPDTVALNATWRRVLLASRGDDPKIVKALPKAAKDVSFVYQARRPFHPTRFYDSIKDVATFAGVLRSTGRIWLPTRMQAPLEWEQAGSSATIRAGSPFWAGIPETEWEVTDEQRDRIRKYWDNQYGDRATELVFVGVGFDKDRLQTLLDGCLLQDEEMVFNNLWENFNDPFVQWVPLDADDEEEELHLDDEEEYPPVIALQNGSDGNGTSDATNSTVIADGVVESVLLPDAVLERASALDIFADGYPDVDDEANGLKSQPRDNGAFVEDDVIIASWDGSVADGILEQMPRVGLPVTIVTGFLGSGKTTLLNHILTTEHGLRIAVLVNEFGEVDIDSQLIEKGDWSDADEIMELANGCICCSINDSFVNAVRKILERKEDVDYLIVETTGVADPVPVINSLMVSDIADEVRVDGILTLVDAENFDGEKHMGSEAALSQILAADTILLSKTDVAHPEAVQRTIDYIKEMRPAARILKSQRGRVPISMILDVGLRISDSPAHMNPVKGIAERTSLDYSGRSEKLAVSEASAGSEQVSADTGENGFVQEHGSVHDHIDKHSHHSSHEHEHTDKECEAGCTDPAHNHGTDGHSHRNHLEADGFVSTSFKSDRAFIAERFMEIFLQNLPEGVFRAKGLLQFQGYEQRYVFNLSGRRYQFEEDDWPEGMAPSNQIVVIGRNLDIDLLRRMLEDCHALNPESSSEIGT